METRITPTEVSPGELFEIDYTGGTDVENGNMFKNDGRCRVYVSGGGGSDGFTATFKAQGATVLPLDGRYGSVQNPDLEVAIVAGDGKVYEVALPPGRFNDENEDCHIEYTDMGEHAVVNVAIVKEIA